MNTILRNKKQILVIAVLLLIIALMMDLNNRLSELSRLSKQRDQEATDVTILLRTEQALKTQVAFATSDAAVRPWAYSEGHKSMPGDVVVVPVSPPDYTPPAPTVIAPTPQKVDNWEVWWALFFGE